MSYVQTDRIQPLEGFAYAFLSDKRRSEDFPPIVASADDPRVIPEVGIFDKRSHLSACLFRLPFLLTPLVVEPVRHPLLCPHRTKGLCHLLINELPQQPFQPLQAVMCAIGATEPLFFPVVLISQRPGGLPAAGRRQLPRQARNIEALLERRQREVRQLRIEAEADIEIGARRQIGDDLRPLGDWVAPIPQVHA